MSMVGDLIGSDCSPHFQQRGDCRGRLAYERQNQRALMVLLGWSQVFQWRTAIHAGKQTTQSMPRRPGLEGRGHERVGGGQGISFPIEFGRSQEFFALACQVMSFAQEMR